MSEELLKESWGTRKKKKKKKVGLCSKWLYILPSSNLHPGMPAVHTSLIPCYCTPPTQNLLYPYCSNEITSRNSPLYSTRHWLRIQVVNQWGYNPLSRSKGPALEKCVTNIMWTQMSHSHPCVLAILIKTVRKTCMITCWSHLQHP